MTCSQHVLVFLVALFRDRPHGASKGPDAAVRGNVTQPFYEGGHQM